MDIFKTPLVVLFEKQNPYRILSNYFSFSGFNKDNHQNINENIFVDLQQQEDKQCSKDDALNIYHIVKDTMKKEVQGIKFEISVFNLLINYSQNILENCGDAVRCNYKNLLKWRMVTLKLDQDLFICSFLAFEDLMMKKDRRYFDWDIIIKSNNIRLHNMLSKGMSENHFHLGGSAPIFKLNWVSIMNDIKNRYLDNKVTDGNRLEKDIDGDVSLEDSIVIAALIRAILFKELKNINKEDDDEIKKMTNILQELINEEGKANKEFISLYSGEIQEEINSLRYIFGADLRYKNNNVKVDYAFTNDMCKGDKSTRLFIGERSFMYNCFKKIYSKEESFIGKADLFYAYLIIKNKIRGELIQQNERVGFSNFSDYQSRKTQYLKKNTILSDAVPTTAILTSIKNQNICSLEARVIPKKNNSINAMDIINTDKNICNEICNDENNHWIREHMNKFNENIKGQDLSVSERKLYYNEKDVAFINKDLLNKYFYVYHFPKRKDVLEDKSKEALDLLQKCRHNKYRNEVKDWAMALYKMRENNQAQANRVLGIDACSNELVTRPEIYGQAFRFLKGHLPNSDYQRELMGERSIQKLRATYHVGEDFLDIVDGLRAIDEVITFLGFTHGDRLGHATVLAIDVEEWYRKKLYRVYLAKQDILDNVAWLISKIKSFNITTGPDTIDKLMSIYNKYYTEIYTKRVENNNYNFNKKDNEKDKVEFYSKQTVVPVDTYISAWQLRGNNPEAYVNNNTIVLGLGYWDRCAIRIKEYNDLVAELYFRYHYDSDVKVEGFKKDVLKIEPYMIEAIIEIQKCMQKYVRARGIGIETNPSSNVSISTFKRYDKHPILNMYNLGLETNEDKETEKPQLFVSINTDDQGVFDTLLENEYALMGIALEKVKDKNGNPIYSQARIYDWLDKVREMGIEQSFRVINDK